MSWVQPTGEQKNVERCEAEEASASQGQHVLGGFSSLSDIVKRGPSRTWEGEG